MTTVKLWKAGSISSHITSLKHKHSKISVETAIHLLLCSTINAHQCSIRYLEFPKQSHIFCEMSHFPENNFGGLQSSVVFAPIWYIYMLCAVHVIGLSCLTRNGEHSQHFLPFSNGRPFNVVHSRFWPSKTFRNHSGKYIPKSDDRITKIHCKTLNWEALCVEVRQVH